MGGLIRTLLAVMLLAGSRIVTDCGAEEEKREGCTLHGNLNKDTGECECRLGYGGDDCSKLLFPACRTSPNGTTWEGHEGFPQNCACHRQYWYFYCGPSKEDGAKCDRGINRKGRCYELEGVPEEEQFSSAPDPSDPRARYYEGIFQDERKAVAREDVVWEGKLSVPNHKCKDSCHDHGHCMEHKDHLGNYFCHCHYGFQGQWCEREESMCFYGCNEGHCKFGFCHCPPGWWGIDCSRSKSYPEAGKTLPPINRLRIFMYDLPMRRAHDLSNHDPNYISYRRFIEWFLKDWVVRTENPHEANMFFIPVLLYWYSSNLGIAKQHVVNVVDYVKTAFPYWNRTKGADHFLFSTQDRALCMYHIEDTLEDSIRMIHFGYYQYNNEIRGTGNKMEACIKPDRDIVVSPNIYKAIDIVTKTWPTEKDKPADPPPKRDKLMFVAGAVRKEDKEYSGGARQIMWQYFNSTNSSDPDIRFVSGYVGDYDQQLRTHKFCLAPWGHGWGIRHPVVMLHGCVPVVIQDYVYQFMEDLIPYHEFSIRMTNDDIPRMGDLLRSISDKEYEQLQEGMKKWSRVFYWDQGEEPYSGKAYEFTLLSLLKRYRYRKGKLVQPTKHCNLPPQECTECQQCPEQKKEECPKCQDCPACPEQQQPQPQQPECPVCPQQPQPPLPEPHPCNCTELCLEVARSMGTEDQAAAATAAASTGAGMGGSSYGAGGLSAGAWAPRLPARPNAGVIMLLVVVAMLGFVVAICFYALRKKAGSGSPEAAYASL